MGPREERLGVDLMDILHHIKKCQIEAIKKGIKDAMVIIDPNIAEVSGLFIPVGGDKYKVYADNTAYELTSPTSLLQVPTMIFGMKIKYDPFISELGANFIITEEQQKKEKTLADFTMDEILDEIRRRTTDEED